MNKNFAAGNRKEDGTTVKTAQSPPLPFILGNPSSFIKFAEETGLAYEVIAFVKEHPERLSICTPRKLGTLSYALKAGIPKDIRKEVVVTIIGYEDGMRFLKLFG